MSSTTVETRLANELVIPTVQQSKVRMQKTPYGRSMSVKLGEVSQLIKLASQHHASEYNRLKFGPRGSPLIYVPFSFQMPGRVKELQARQAECVEQRVWWPCNRAAVRNASTIKIASEPMQPILSRPSYAIDLPQELNAAMSVSLLPLDGLDDSAPQCDVPIKTSDSHPINVSPIIPLELLRIISSHLIQTEGSPVIFDLPSSHYLDRVTAYSPDLPPGIVPWPSNHATPVIVTPPRITTVSPDTQHHSTQPCAPQCAVTRPPKFAHFLWSNPLVRRVVNPIAAIHANRPVINPPSVPTNSDCTQKHGADGQYDAPNLAQCLTISLSISESFEKAVGDGLCRSLSSPSLPTYNASQPAIPRTTFSVINDVSPAIAVSHSLTSQLESAAPQRFSKSQFQSSGTVTLGNLFLSSCPGKKVRLNGPVKGRCGVCRDLRKDLCRIKELGVACIVCCLDDDELQLLGVTWADYSRTAHEMGIDILRIPTPEGLAPAPLDKFDEQLGMLIENYTLRGLPMLVHCRGGVGRAGLVACCWMLKLGLCGWIETAPALACPITDGNHNPKIGQGTTPIRRDTMQMVERVITVVRRQRSPKAVETYEQVQFLTDFVELLRAKSKLANTVSVADALEGRIN
ncbi:phosphatases II [Laetiporus sulphureus 93-53]|uniref:Phosphatases II n=1 Tax=Laetiporus sulphureus 93-53 TaxID=1314785 RepID=A0A165DD75_9APHY|nr:phosphatases II [Laetiporus sulphureus 93-53]KZT04610.1 phosphatases II [Laetiporus sulphureus 93-53]